VSAEVDPFTCGVVEEFEGEAGVIDIKERVGAVSSCV
jgi:hypothetical protein